MIMVLHQLPSVYINQSFANVGRTTSYIRGTGSSMMKFECRGCIVEFVQIMHETCAVLIVEKDRAPVNALVDYMIELH